MISISSSTPHYPPAYVASLHPEPHFGEVWKWESMGPYMVIALLAAPEGDDVVCIDVAVGSSEWGVVTTLHWDYRGAYRDKWHRIDEGELV